jgi:hypothetical protein
LNIRLKDFHHTLGSSDDQEELDYFSRKAYEVQLKQVHKQPTDEEESKNVEIVKKGPVSAKEAIKKLS